MFNSEKEFVSKSDKHEKLVVGGVHITLTAFHRLAILMFQKVTFELGLFRKKKGFEANFVQNWQDVIKFGLRSFFCARKGFQISKK